MLGNPLQVPSCTGCTTVTSDRYAKANFATLDGRDPNFASSNGSGLSCCRETFCVALLDRSGCST
jgi:hypothetical protein